jgi:hypothetical protein
LEAEVVREVSYTCRPMVILHLVRRNKNVATGKRIGGYRNLEHLFSLLISAYMLLRFLPGNHIVTYYISLHMLHAATLRPGAAQSAHLSMHASLLIFCTERIPLYAIHYMKHAGLVHVADIRFEQLQRNSIELSPADKLSSPLALKLFRASIYRPVHP